ncbi:MAG: hypothetical protein AAF569_00475 [Pseudomonadota bacterium]
MSEHDIVSGPWINVDVPNLNHDFDVSRDSLRHTQTQKMQQRDAQGEGSFAAHKDKLTHELTPPQGIIKNLQSDDELLFRHWLKQQWLSAMAAAYRRNAQELERDDHLSPQPLKENQPMTQETRNPNAPLQQFKDGAVTLKLWEQEHQERKYLNISVGKLYKDKQGQWREGNNMNAQDLLKLQNLIPIAYAQIQQIQEQHRQHNQAVQDRINHEQVNEMALQSKPAPQQDMAAARDAAMRGSDMAEQQHANTQEHAQEPSYQPSLDHSR